MIYWIISIGTAYLFYNTSWDNLMYYCEMKTQEKMGIYSYYEYDEERESELNSDAEDEKEILASSSVSLLDSFREGALEKMMAYYFNILMLYYRFQNKWLEWENQYTAISYLTNTLRYVSNKWNRITCPHFLEPDENIWVNNVFLYRVKQENGTFAYNIHENYATIYSDGGIEQFKGRMTSCIKQNAFKTYCNVETPIGVIHVIEHMVLGKCFDEENRVKYVVAKDSFSPDIKKSRAKFMSVEYTNPAMENAVPIDIPNEMLVSGNVLFTPAFVLRALKYQKEAFYFDMDYMVRIMDDMMNIYSLKSDEHILLNKIGYTVVKSNIFTG